MTLTLLHGKMFDVGDLPVGPTDFRQLCKTGVIKWPVKLNVGLRLFTFFCVFLSKSKNMTFYVF